MNVFSLRALWKAIRGRSLIFSLVFAMAILGSSFAGILQTPLRLMGFWLPVVWIFPIFAVGYLSKKETSIPISPQVRRIASYLLIGGSILISFALYRYEKSWSEKFPEPTWLHEKEEPPLRTGPRGKR